MPKKRTLKDSDFKLPAGPMSKPSERPIPARRNIYDLDAETRKTLRNLRSAARGQSKKK